MLFGQTPNQRVCQKNHKKVCGIEIICYCTDNTVAILRIFCGKYTTFSPHSNKKVCAIESVGESAIKKHFVMLEKSRTFAN